MQFSNVSPAVTPPAIKALVLVSKITPLSKMMENYTMPANENVVTISESEFQAIAGYYFNSVPNSSITSEEVAHQNAVINEISYRFINASLAKQGGAHIVVEPRITDRE